MHSWGLGKVDPGRLWHSLAAWVQSSHEGLSRLLESVELLWFGDQDDWLESFQLQPATPETAIMILYSPPTQPEDVVQERWA